MLLGDVNINLLDQNLNVTRYMDTLISNGYNVLNEISASKPTRVDDSRGSISIIDHVVSDIQSDYSLHLADHHLSDHKVLFLKLNLVNKNFKNAKQKYPSKIINYFKLRESIREKLTNNTELTFESLIDIIKTETESVTTSKLRNYTNNI